MRPIERRAWFQSTRPRGRTRLHGRHRLSDQACFNPRVLAGGRDQLRAALPGIIRVSIHASSREDATFAIISYEIRTCFNPRVLAGGRDKFAGIAEKGSNVSIHASSREDATSSET